MAPRQHIRIRLRGDVHPIVNFSVSITETMAFYSLRLCIFLSSVAINHSNSIYKTVTIVNINLYIFRAKLTIR